MNEQNKVNIKKEIENISEHSTKIDYKERFKQWNETFKDNKRIVKYE